VDANWPDDQCTVLAVAQLEDKVRELLSGAKHDANEMFRVCAKFNALFVRPRIQGKMLALGCRVRLPSS